MYPLYPAALRLNFMTSLRTFYIDTYHDQFFTHPPAWFGMYAWMEALYHLPLSIWAVGALLRGTIQSNYFALLRIERLTCRVDDPRVPIQLLIYAVQTAVTTATCIADYMSWTAFSTAEKAELGKLYVPYLALCRLYVGLVWNLC